MGGEEQVVICFRLKASHAYSAWRTGLTAALWSALLLTPSHALSNDSPAGIGRSDLASAWNGDLLILPGLILVAALYGRGAAVVWRRAGVGKGISVWQVLSFYGGLITLLAAVASPLDALAHTLFAGHMAQHMLLVLLAAPLLAFGTPVLPLLWALSPQHRIIVVRWWQRAAWPRSLWAALSQPIVVWLLFAAALWAWHLPSLYQLAVVSPLVHAFEHVTLLATSYLFWWLVVQPLGHRKLHHGAAILFVFTASVQVTLLGALISIAPEPLYPIYGPGAGLWGLELVADQRLAALIMRTPMAVVFLLTVAALFLRWLTLMERRNGGDAGG